jgi:hypothetical protein
MEANVRKLFVFQSSLGGTQKIARIGDACVNPLLIASDPIQLRHELEIHSVNSGHEHGQDPDDRDNGENHEKIILLNAIDWARKQGHSRRPGSGIYDQKPGYWRAA